MKMPLTMALVTCGIYLLEVRCLHMPWWCICYLLHYLLGSMLPLFQYIAGLMQPPILIQAPQVIDDIIPQQIGLHNNWRSINQWYLVPDRRGYGSLLLAWIATEFTGNEPAITYLN